MTDRLIQMLKDDHDMVKNLLNEAAENEDASKFRQIKDQLEMHMLGEEKYFYPPLSKVDKEGMDQSFEEHNTARKILKEMDKIHWKDEQWMPKLRKLKETVENHVEREENLIFPEATEKFSNLQREGMAQRIEEEKMSKRFKSIPNEKLVPLPQDIDIPKDIPASKVRIPSMYANGDFQYEDAQGNPVNKDKATHIRFTGMDKRSDVVVGPVQPEGMIRLTLYLDDDNLPAIKEKSTNSRSKIFNEGYMPIRK